MTIFTCGAWVLVWLGVALFGGEKRTVVAVDGGGVAREQSVDSYSVVGTAVAIVILAAMVLYGATRTREAPRAAPASVAAASIVATQPMHAEQLAAAYAENEDVADNRYRGVRLTIDGKIESAGKRADGRWYVRVHAGDTMIVQCITAKKPPAFDPGEAARLVGTGAGVMLRAPLIEPCVASRR